MKTLEFGLGTTLEKILDTLTNIEETELTLVIPQDALLLQNPVNIKILEKQAKLLGKTIQFAHGITLPAARKEEVVEESMSLDPQEWEEHNNLESVPTFKNAKGARKWLSFGSLFKQRNALLGLGVVAILLFVIGGGFFFLQDLPSAKITLYLDSQPLEKQISVTGSPLITEVDSDKGRIPLTTLDTTKSSSSSAKTTGKKTVGTSAKGIITIRNYNTVTDKTFAKGTIVKAVGDLEGTKYTTSDNVTVVHGTTTSRIDSTGKKINETDPGRKDVTIVASDYGEKFNAKAGTDFVVGGEGFENVNAVSTLGITGGSSKEVVVVSDSDVKSLEEKITKDILSSAKDEFNTKITSNQKIIDSAIVTKVTKRTLSKQVGEEADTVGLSLDESVSTVAYNQKDLESLMAKEVTSSVTAGYELAQGSQINAEVVKSDGKEVTLLARLKGSMLTKVDKVSLIDNLKGKSLSFAQNYLHAQSNIAGFEIVLKPTLPGPFKKIPSSASKISVEMVKKS